MKTFAATSCLLAAVLLSSFTAPEASAAQVAWKTWEAGLREAAASKRPVLVDVYTDWCKFCWRMDAEVYANPEVREYLAKRFVAIKLNAESSKSAPYQGRSHTARSLASAFGVTGYPTTVFLGPDGERLVNVPGYVKADRFLLLLRYVGEGYLERGVPFPEFERTVARSAPSKKDG